MIKFVACGSYSITSCCFLLMCSILCLYFVWYAFCYFMKFVNVHVCLYTTKLFTFIKLFYCHFNKLYKAYFHHERWWDFFLFVY